MSEEKPIIEEDIDSLVPDPYEIPIRDRKVITQPYDFAVTSLLDQLKSKTIFLRPMSNRPNFQRKYVWNDEHASKLIESILLKIPIPPCYLSQNDDCELDVIDGQQRLYSIYRFVNNQFPLVGLQVLSELNTKRFYEIDSKLQRQINTHTMRCVLITNESHPEVKFDVFERLNTNTVPLNQQELRNCMYRGKMNDLISELSIDDTWLSILGKNSPDKRMRDEELILRFFAFHIEGIEKYRTPLKYWLNDVAKNGMRISDARVNELKETWKKSIEISLSLFSPNKCFRRPHGKVINKALFDLIMYTASKTDKIITNTDIAHFHTEYDRLTTDEAFSDLISRSVDHTLRTKERFRIWNNTFSRIL